MIIDIANGTCSDGILLKDAQEVKQDSEDTDFQKTLAEVKRLEEREAELLLSEEYLAREGLVVSAKEHSPKIEKKTIGEHQLCIGGGYSPKDVHQHASTHVSASAVRRNPVSGGARVYGHSDMTDQLYSRSRP